MVLKYSPEIDKNTMIIGFVVGGQEYPMEPIGYSELKGLTSALLDIQSSMAHELNIGSDE